MAYKCANCGHEEAEMEGDEEKEEAGENKPEKYKSAVSGGTETPTNLSPIESAQNQTDGDDELKKKRKASIAAVIAKKINKY